MEYNFFEKLEELENKIFEIKESLDKKEITNQFKGCFGCVYEAVEEWNLPCCKCARGCKDYYRGAKNESEQ